MPFWFSLHIEEDMKSVYIEVVNVNRYFTELSLASKSS